MRILWIPHTGWHIPQRAHLFCRALAERHEVHVTDWVADFATPRDYLSQRYLENFTYRRYHDSTIIVHGIPRISPALYTSILRRFNTWLFERFVQQIVKQYQIDVVVGTFVVPPPKAPRVVFDLFDDNVAYWRSYGRVAEYANEIKQTEQLYLQTADAIVAASHVLRQQASMRGARGEIHLIPNGIDLKRFVTTKRDAIRSELGVQGKLVGVVGSHDKICELDNILDAAQILANENITFLIAGRGNALPYAQKRALKQNITNVIWKGYVTPDQAVDLVSALDVGLCPYKKTPGADASSPMRLLMYTAAGVPTVCTDLTSVREMRLPNTVLVADNSQALVEGILTALQLPRQRPAEIETYNLPCLVKKYEAVLSR